MREQLVNLMLLHRMTSTTETKNAFAEIIIQIFYTESKTEIEIHVDGKNCCTPSVCSSS